MTASGPLSPGDAPPPDRAHPPATSAAEMTLAEKLACEWEARHDVKARTGRPGDPAALAHYITHTRCADSLHPAHPHVAHPHEAHPHEAHPHGRAPKDPLRSWLRWGEDTR